MNLSRRGIALAASPSMLMLVSFYSLAIHMHLRLGGWPSGIGERGFPGSLTLHAYSTVYCFTALVLFACFVIPVLVVGSAFFYHLRRYVRYFGLYVLFFVVCWGLMQLAPQPFLNWWLD